MCADGEQVAQPIQAEELRRLPPPSTPHLQQLTLDLTDCEALLSFCLDVTADALPHLRLLVLVHNSVSGVHLKGALHLAACMRLEAIYLSNVLPEELSLPPRCTLHLCASCEDIVALSLQPTWTQPLMQLRSLCQQPAELHTGAYFEVPPLAQLPATWLTGLTALSIMCSAKVALGSRAAPCSLAALPALQRLVIDSPGGVVHLFVPEGMPLKRLWARRLHGLGLALESAAAFSGRLEDLSVHAAGFFAFDWPAVEAGLRQRGMRLMTRQPLCAGRTSFVIEGCRYDGQIVDQLLCVCGTCLDCLLRRAGRVSELANDADRAPF